jgi:hypothetical protein
MILSDARELLYDTVVPSINSEDKIDLVDKYINLAQERLIHSGKWRGMTKEIAVTAPTSFITLPPRFVSCLAIRYLTDDGLSASISIRNQWFRYLNSGTDLSAPDSWFSCGWIAADDLGDGFYTLADSPYDEYYLKFTRSNPGDNNLAILVKGYDSAGEIIFTDNGSESFEGIITTLSAATIQTSQKFTNQIYFLRKQISQGYIALDAVDVATGGTTRIGYYMPGETQPSYHRYLTGDISETYDTVAAICKLRYLPSVTDADEVVPGNIGALRNMLIALKHETEGDKERYAQYFADAIMLLNDETRESRGGSRLSLNIDASAYQFSNLWQGR